MINCFKNIVHTLVDLKVPKNDENRAHFSIYTVTLQVQQLHQWLLSTRFDECYLEQRRLCGNTYTFSFELRVPNAFPVIFISFVT